MTHKEELITQAIHQTAQLALGDEMFDPWEWDRIDENSEDPQHVEIVAQCEALGLTGEKLEQEVAARYGALVYATMRVNKGNYEFDMDPEHNWLND